MAVRTRRYENLADVLRALGVPPHRVLWNPRPGTATEADQVRICDTKRLVELIDGILVEKAMGYRESSLALALVISLGTFVRSQNLGVLAGADGIMRLRPGRNRLPDVSFTAWANVPPGGHLQSVADFPPDLAVEILSASNTRREMARKRREYFQSGTRLVWIIDPVARTVAAYTDARAHTLLTEADTLTAADVLPGWSLPLAEFFADPQPAAPA